MIRKILFTSVFILSLVCIICFFLAALEYFIPWVNTPVVEFTRDHSRLLFWTVSYGKTDFMLGLWAVITAIMFFVGFWALKNIFRTTDAFDERFESDWLGV